MYQQKCQIFSLQLTIQKITNKKQDKTRQADTYKQIKLAKDFIIKQIKQIKANDLLQYFLQDYICKQCFAQDRGSYSHITSGKLIIEGECDKIIQGIYLGDQDAAAQQTILSKCNISAVLTCGKQLLTPFTSLFKYKKYHIQDYPNQNILDLFDQSRDWIHQMRQQGRNVLIHCSAGVSRSSSFTIAYLMKQYKMSYEKAYQTVKQKRKVIRPNFGFIQQLKQYQKIIKSESNQKDVQKE